MEKKSLIIINCLLGIIPFNAWSMGRFGRIGTKIAQVRPWSKVGGPLQRYSSVLSATSRGRQGQSHWSYNSYKLPLALIGAGAALGATRSVYAKEEETRISSEELEDFGKDFFTEAREEFNPLPLELHYNIAILLEQWGFVRGENEIFYRYDNEKDQTVELIVRSRSDDKWGPGGHLRWDIVTIDQKINKCWACITLHEKYYLTHPSNGEIENSIGHELGHLPAILDGRNNDSNSYLTMRKLEFEADILSIELNGTTEGGVKFFKEGAQQEKSFQFSQSEKNKFIIGTGVWYLGLTASQFLIPLTALPILLYGAPSIYKALIRIHPSDSERIAHINEYAKQKGWERRETEEGQEYYVRP